MTRNEAIELLGHYNNFLQITGADCDNLEPEATEAFLNWSDWAKKNIKIELPIGLTSCEVLIEYDKKQV
jgi:hypothetical protein